MNNNCLYSTGRRESNKIEKKLSPVPKIILYYVQYILTMCTYVVFRGGLGIQIGIGEKEN